MKVRFSSRLSLLLMMLLLVSCATGTRASWLDGDYVFEAELKLSNTSVRAGESLTVQAEIVTGGIPPFTYDYFWDVEENGIVREIGNVKASPFAEHTQLIPSGDRGVVAVIVRDSAGHMAMAGVPHGTEFPLEYFWGYGEFEILHENEPTADDYPTSIHSQNGITVQFIYKDANGKLMGQNADNMMLQCGDTVQITAILTGASYSDYEEGWGRFGDDIDNPFILHNNELTLSSYIMPGSPKEISPFITIKNTQFFGNPIHISDGMDGEYIAMFDKTSVRIGDTINLNLKLPYYYVAISYGYFDDLRWVTVDENGNETYSDWLGITDDFFHERNFQFVPTKGIKGAAEILFAGPGDNYIRRTDYFTIQPPAKSGVNY
ncbi:MAG: hypothetical protein ACOX7B_15725 [Christensenellales bacterium]|jgi:hypothetical protein